MHTNLSVPQCGDLLVLVHPHRSFRFPAALSPTTKFKSAAARSQARPLAAVTTRQAFGGPSPFGTGNGLLQVELQQQADLRAAAPDSQEEAEKGWKRLKYKLVGNPRQGLQHLTEQQQHEILEERLKARLPKFWGLICEADRPWQRKVIVHLAIELPPPACYRYQQLKPSSLQQIISQRAQVEKQCWAHHEELSWHTRQLQRWYTQARRGAPTVTHYRLGQTRYELTQLQSAIRTSLRTLQTLMDGATSLADTDYIQYALTDVEPLLVHFDELCVATRDQGVRGVDALCRGLERDSARNSHSDRDVDVTQQQGLASGSGGRNISQDSEGSGNAEGALSDGQQGDGRADLAGGKQGGSREGNAGSAGRRAAAATPHYLLLPELRDPATVIWRYPPQEFVEVRKKGLRGGGLHTLTEAREGVWEGHVHGQHSAARQLAGGSGGVGLLSLDASRDGGWKRGEGEQYKGPRQLAGGEGGPAIGGNDRDKARQQSASGALWVAGGGVLQYEDEQLMMETMQSSPLRFDDTDEFRGMPGSKYEPGGWDVGEALPALGLAKVVVRKGLFDP